MDNFEFMLKLHIFWGIKSL